VDQWRIESPQSLDLTGVRKLNIRLVAGSADVVGSPEGEADGAAHVEVSEIKGPLLVSKEGDTLTITHERLTWGGLFDWVGGNRRAEAVVSVSVPQGCPVELGLVSADAVVSAIAGRTKVKSVSGDVTLDGVSADISAQTVSGDLESRQLVGSLQFTTVSGDLTVVESASGAVRAETVSGQVTLDLEISSEAKIELKSVSGDLTLRLPEDAGMQVDVRTMSGSLDSGFAGVQSDNKPGKASLRGQVGSGRGQLRAKTVSGDVTLLRRSTA
jgi:hypothetical protein